MLQRQSLLLTLAIYTPGRTGRCGKKGVATTFINKNCEETTLLDLKHLLMEAKQRIPPVSRAACVQPLDQRADSRAVLQPAPYRTA